MGSLCYSKTFLFELGFQIPGEGTSDLPTKFDPTSGSGRFRAIVGCRIVTFGEGKCLGYGAKYFDLAHFGQRFPVKAWVGA